MKLTIQVLSYQIKSNLKRYCDLYSQPLICSRTKCADGSKNMPTNRLTNFMSFEEFIIVIKSKIEEILGDDYDIHFNHVLKNNSIELDGLVILRAGSSISPSIYLNSYYEAYLASVSIEFIVENIMNEYKKSIIDERMNQFSIPYNFNEMKSNIIFRLVNYEKNKNMLNTVPFVPFLDLAITFHCLVKHNEDGIGTIRINNELMKYWDISIEELKKLGKENTTRLFPPVIQTMNEIVNHILINNASNGFMERDEYDVFNKEIDLENRLKNRDGYDTKDMFVLTNKKGINGASCLLYPNILNDLAEKLDSDLYILPSSIHEIILVEKDNSFEKEDLIRMVKDINLTQVPIEDVLSNNVYVYSRLKDSISY